MSVRALQTNSECGPGKENHREPISLPAKVWRATYHITRGGSRKKKKCEVQCECVILGHFLNNEWSKVPKWVIFKIFVSHLIAWMPGLALHFTGEREAGFLAQIHIQKLHFFNPILLSVYNLF